MQDDAPRRHAPGDRQLADILALLQAEFAYMEGRIDPPSSLHRLSVDGIARHCAAGEVWSLGDPPHACLFLTPKPGALYLGKLAVASDRRGQGLARRMVELADTRARALGLPVLELETRIELVENHAAFGRMGFVVTGQTAHPGHDRPTSLTLRKPVGGQ